MIEFILFLKFGSDLKDDRRKISKWTCFPSSRLRENYNLEGKYNTDSPFDSEYSFPWVEIHLHIINWHLFCRGIVAIAADDSGIRLNPRKKDVFWRWNKMKISLLLIINNAIFSSGLLTLGTVWASTGILQSLLAGRAAEENRYG